MSAEFFNFFNHGFVRVAVAIPEVRAADPRFNVERTIAMMHEAAESAACVVVFPELGLSGYTCDDLFHHRIGTGSTSSESKRYSEVQQLDVGGRIRSAQSDLGTRARC